MTSGRPAGLLRDYVYWFAYYDGFTEQDHGFRMIPEDTTDVLIPLEGRVSITSGASGEGGR